VLEVGHDRLAPRLDVDEVEVVLQIETCGPSTAARSSARSAPRAIPSPSADPHQSPQRRPGLPLPFRVFSGQLGTLVIRTTAST
jgi:hypothetical protein